MQSVVRQVACPACGKKTEWSPQSHFRPFCSARCKGIDLGAWASESYRIAGREHDPNDKIDDTSLEN